MWLPSNVHRAERNHLSLCVLSAEYDILQGNHSRTSMAKIENFIIAVDKVIGTINFLMLHLWKIPYKMRAFSGTVIIMSST
jgi:hypothetical protein